MAAVLAGAPAKLPLVWGFADATNALMAIPDLVALLLLNKAIVAETNRFLWSGRIEDEELSRTARPSLPRRTRGDVAVPVGTCYTVYGARTGCLRSAASLALSSACTLTITTRRTSTRGMDKPKRRSG